MAMSQCETVRHNSYKRMYNIVKTTTKLYTTVNIPNMAVMFDNMTGPG